MRKKILLGVLDWGLGHASRCVPLIRTILQQDDEVILASSGAAGSFLQEEFSDLPYIELPSYRIHYSGTHHQTLVLLRQLPHIVNTIRKEHALLPKLIDQYQVDAIISDNRYGLWNASVPSAFLTHQLSPKSPFAPVFFNPVLRKIHYFLIQRFTFCWVCDFPGEDNLSGSLSHGFRLPENTFFTGPLSRFSPVKTDPGEKETGPDILIVLSGPEPQRTILEKLLLKQCMSSTLKIHLVRGIREPFGGLTGSDRLTVIPYLNTDQLFREISLAKLIISRSGYSSLMDYAHLGKKAVFIPTPGQTEQEYLARYHQESEHYFSESQPDFRLDRAIAEAARLKAYQVKPTPERLLTALKKLIGKY